MKKQRLLWQIYPSYLVIVLISLGAVTLYMSNSYRRFYLQQTGADLESRAHLLEKQISGYLSPADLESIDPFCKQIGGPSATRITVILPSGKVIGDSHENSDRMDNHLTRPELVQAFAGGVGTSIRYSQTLQRKMMYVAVPVLQNKVIVAALRTAIPITSIDEELAYIRARIFMGGLLIALMAAAISWVVSRRISRPIEEMKQGAELFAHGDLTYRLPGSGSEEMARLADAMNQMAGQLDERIKHTVEQRNKMEAVLASMQEGVLAVDKEEHIISMNQAAGRIFNANPSHVQGRTIQEAIRNIELHRFLKRALASAENMEEDITLFQDKERVLYSHSTPLRDADEKRIGTLIVLNDITRIRRLENIRRDFVANVTHEIKTPLTAIKGFVETLRNGSVDNPEETERFLGIVLKHVDRLEAIIEGLLSLSRIEREEELDELDRIKIKDSRIKDVMRSALQICQPKADEKNVQIELICDPEMIVRMDPHRIEEASVNLLDNAIKYSDAKSIIQVTVLPEHNEIIIRFEDQGVGIAQEHLPRLFERFYRVDKARSRHLGGTGLGLAIVKHIAQAHGGDVTVESTPGTGSKFEIHLPINDLSVQT
jgi:two-component system phosphate regulon sensor histidine kinase PhoR